jgi:hypothetical protein
MHHQAFRLRSPVVLWLLLLLLLLLPDTPTVLLWLLLYAESLEPSNEDLLPLSLRQ